MYLNYVFKIHNLYGLSLQSGECFGSVGNSSERLRAKLVSLGLGRKNGHELLDSDDLIACLHDSDSVGGLTSVFSSFNSSPCDFSLSGGFSSCICSTVTVGFGSFFGLFFN